jgi:hypothetical protein
MSRFALILLVAASGCASSTGSTTTGSPAAPQTVRVGQMGSGGSTTMNVSTAAHVTTVAFPVEDVWRFLPTVWDSLGIPKALIDPKSHTLSNQGMKIRQRLGKVPLSRYIDCGTTQIGPNADSYEVYLTVTSQVVSASASEATISTVVDAAARPLNFSQEYSRCTTRGLLESRVVDGIKAQFKR